MGKHESRGTAFVWSPVFYEEDFPAVAVSHGAEYTGKSGQGALAGGAAY